MFVGHGLLAFALVAGVAHLRGWRPERALAVGLLAGAFGMLPDVDIAYAPVALLLASDLGGPLATAQAFWAAGNLVHRAVTHSVVVGPVVALGLRWIASRDRRLRSAGGVGLLALPVVALVVSGPLGSAITTLFVAGAALLAFVGRRHGFAPTTIAAAALVGLVSHPFGDLFTGEPPAMLYPLSTVPTVDRIVLHPDPTLHLLGALGLELATAWLALSVYLVVRHGVGRPAAFPGAVRRVVAGRAAAGAGYAGTFFVLPAPTLDLSYHFVFPLLGVGLLVALPTPRTVRGATARPVRVVATGLAAVTAATLAYALVYVTVGW
ncbi:metal-dependent hydrolase [Salinirubellus sp. GCM10025818]|uniref:metal-dependent hydrolase n=1 Tax=Salinirubellus TaxID=2162630 RepID=UPI0030D1C384